MHRHRVSALRRTPAQPDVTIRASDAVLTRIVFGLQNPYEAYLQLDAQVTPPLTDRSRDLLETLWPRMRYY